LPNSRNWYTLNWSTQRQTEKNVKKPAKPTSPAANALGPKQQAFVLEYLIDLNATAAYKRAGYACKNDATAQAASSRLLSNVMVQKAIQDAMAARAKRVEVSVDDVLRRWLAIANADPNELIELRRTCCRFCHGNGMAQRTRLTSGRNP